MMDRKDKAIEAKLRKASEAFSVPDVREAAKAQYLAEKKDESQETAPAKAKKRIWPYPVFGSLATVGAVAIVLFATPIRNVIFNNSSAASIATTYSTYTLKSKQEKIVFDSLVGASYLTKDTTSNILKSRIRYAPGQDSRKQNEPPTSGNENRDAYLSELNSCMPLLEVALSSYNASITASPASSSNYDYSLKASVSLLDSKTISATASVADASASDAEAFGASGVLETSSASLNFSVARAKQNNDYFATSSIAYPTTGASITLEEKSDTMRPGGAKMTDVTYKAADGGQTKFSFCLGQKDQMPTVEIRLFDFDHPIDFVVSQDSTNGRFEVISSHPGDEMNSFFVYPKDNSDGQGSYYDYKGGPNSGNNWDYQGERSKAPNQQQGN
jgi:hypothetical protein